MGWRGRNGRTRHGVAETSNGVEQPGPETRGPAPPRSRRRKNGSKPAGWPTLAPGSLLALYLAAATPARAQVPPGFFDVSTVPGVDPSGATDSTAGLNRAIEMARNADAVAYFPPGDYRIRDTLRGAIGTWMSRTGPCTRRGGEVVLMGAYRGDRPRLVLENGSPGFGDPSAPKPVVHVFLPNPQPGDPDRERANCAFRSGIVNLEIVLGDNPGAVGVKFDGAQESFVQGVRVDARGGFAGFSHLPGRSSVSIGLEVVGGRHGLWLRDGSLGAQLVGLTLRDQTAAAIVTGVWRGISVTGFEIRGPGPAVEALSGNPQLGNVVLIDGTVEQTRPGPLVQTTSRFVGLRNVFVRGATAVVPGGPALPSSGWTAVMRHANLPAASRFSGNGVAGAAALVDGSPVTEPELTIRPVAMPPSDLVARHLFELPSWDRPGTVDVRDFGAVPDDGEDDTAALQAAIDRGGDVFLPAGRYLVSAPLRLGADVRLFGAFRHNSVLDADPAWRPASQTWMVETVDDPEASTYLGDLLIDHPTDASLLLSGVRWRAGRRSLFVRVRYESAANRAETQPRHAFRVEGGGGGRWYGWHDFQRAARRLRPVDPDFRKLFVAGTREPLTFYGFNPEHTQASAAIELVDAQNVRFIGAKDEALRPVFVLRDVRNFFGAMYVNNPIASGQDVVQIFGGERLELLGFLAPPEDGPVGSLVVEASLPGAASVGRDRFLARYRRGEIDWSVWTPAAAVACGDGRCEDTESCASCPADCGCGDGGSPRLDGGSEDASTADAETTDSGLADGSAGDAGTAPPSPGCACRAGTGTRHRTSWLDAFLVLLFLGVRRRRSTRHTSWERSARHRVSWWLVVVAVSLATAGCGGTDGRAGAVVDLVTDLRPGEAFVEAQVELFDARSRSVRRVGEEAVVGQRWQWPPRRVAEFPDLGEGRYELQASLRDVDGRTVLSRRYALRLRSGLVRRVLVVLSSDCLEVSCPGVAQAPTNSECLAGRCVPPGCVDGDEEDCVADLACKSNSDCGAGRPGCPEECVAGVCWPACPAQDAGQRDGGTDRDGGRCATATACSSLSCPACQRPACGADGTCVCVPVEDGTACADDGLTCTADLCREGSCEHRPDDGACGPGRYCSPTGDCVECTSDGHCDDGKECTVDRCVDGSCSASNAPDGTDCSCGACVAGSCSRRFAQVAAGYSHSCAVSVGGELLCWGLNDYGQLGLGDTSNRTGPTRVGSDSDWQQVSTGWNHTCGTKRDGTLYCWGDNGLGQLGLGDTSNRTEPTRVGSDSDWRQVSAGLSHTCSVRSDGSLFCWGDNGAGQLGLGDRERRTLPAQVGTTSDWLQVSVNRAQTCAVKLDGTLYCWGDNSLGQLGLGDTTSGTFRPRRVGSADDWQQVSTGSAHTCGLRSVGAVLCWGKNGAGRLGLGDTMDRSTPARVGTTSDWRSVRAGQAHTCGVKRDGTLYCWGWNASGQLGQGHTRERTLPTQVGSANSWWQLDTGNQHTCGVMDDGTLHCWGENGYGQLGLGERGTERTTPVAVPGGTCS